MPLVILVLLCLFVSTPVLAEPADCKGYEKEGCYCGSQLSKLTVTLPPGLRVDAVCGLHFRNYNPDGIHNIDLARESLSLDSYRNGNYPQGKVYLLGTMQNPVSGTVTVHEGPSGSLWFHGRPNPRGPVFWEYHLKTLRLGSDIDFKKLGAPRPETLQGLCWEAEATLRIRNPVVLLGQTDEAGTDGDFDVIHIAKFKPCAGREDPVANLVRWQPDDVVALIRRIISCNYYQGEWPYADEAKKKEHASEIERLNCSTLPDEENRIRTKYSDNADVNRAINAARKIK